MVVASESATTVIRLPQLGAQVVRVDGSVQSAISAFEANPAVAYAEPNRIYHAEAVPNDSRYSQTYGLPRIQAPQAWDVTTGSAGVTVAIVDTGVIGERPRRSGAEHGRGGELRHRRAEHNPRLQRAWDARRRHDRREGNNGIGVAGVNWNVHLMPLRVLNGDGSGSSSDIATAFASTCTPIQPRSSTPASAERTTR